MSEPSRPATATFPEAYRAYVARVPSGDLVSILETQLDDTLAIARLFSPGREEHRYAPDKWSVREVLGHVTDAERVFALRILWIARGSTVDQPGWDENAWAGVSNAGARPLPELEHDLRAVRRSTLTLLSGLDAAAWKRRGSANGLDFSVAQIACIVAGHELHHRALLEERYL